MTNTFPPNSRGWKVQNQDACSSVSNEGPFLPLVPCTCSHLAEASSGLVSEDTNSTDEGLTLLSRPLLGGCTSHHHVEGYTFGACLDYSTSFSKKATSLKMELKEKIEILFHRGQAVGQTSLPGQTETCQQILWRQVDRAISQLFGHMVVVVGLYQGGDILTLLQEFPTVLFKIVHLSATNSSLVMPDPCPDGCSLKSFAPSTAGSQVSPGKEQERPWGQLPPLIPLHLCIFLSLFSISVSLIFRIVFQRKKIHVVVK